MLEIDQHSWHARLYAFWRRCREWRRPGYARQENLCHYVRVVLIWAPLAWFCYGRANHRIRPWMIPAVALAIGLNVMGIVRAPESTGEVWLAIVIGGGGSALILGLGVGSVWVGRHVIHLRPERTKAAHQTFGGILIEWGKAKKRRICPLITFHNGEGK